MDKKMKSWIGFWLKRNYRSICNYLDHELEQYNITNSQLGVLLILWESDGTSQKEVQQTLGITPASMTNLIKGLENKGLIIRRVDPNDSRANLMYLTDKGKALEEKCLPIVEEAEVIVRKGFSPEETMILRLWLQRVNKNIEI
ncbi:MarR family winged helix-turn-helix transcriptional regulator [Peribacillus frigoritolerans]|uniref:MarR family winged helix-turn-helix transcriptional regulator n=1 Tax=Peribacillus frigoritolerans TaxID=450367 RepID=UPI00207A4F4C|nr:MarR family transcriptional regulator [Peribacillus frigoritolerans]USK74429.1 MarR family transcriptional regulator [Peribacillus frigoritolerans]